MTLPNSKCLLALDLVGGQDKNTKQAGKERKKRNTEYESHL